MHSPFFLFEVICSKFLTALRGYYTSDKEKYNQMVLKRKLVHVYEKKLGFSLFFLFEVICSKFLTALRGYYTSDKEKYNQMVLKRKLVHVYEKKLGFSLIKTA